MNRLLPRLTAIVVITVLAVAASWAGVAPAHAGERVVELAPVKMGYTDLLQSGEVTTAEPDLLISRLRYRTYLTYDLSALGPADQVVAAALQLSIGASDADEPGVRVRTVADDWSPDHLSHRDAPEPTDVVLNPGDRTVFAPNTSQSLRLSDLQPLTIRGPLGLAMDYDSLFTSIALPKATPPMLRLTVQAPTVPPADPTLLPYAAAVPGTSERKVFAHYFPPYPISIDNAEPAVDYYSTQYLRPDGEDGKWRAAGGLLRDRPLERPPIEGDYQLADATTEVDQATQAGIDGFTVNIMTWSGVLWDRALTMNRAVEQAGNGFVTIPNIDMTTDAGRADVVTMSDRLAEFYASPAAYRLADGRYLLSSFKAEARSPKWWRALIADLQERHGISVGFVGVMLHLDEAKVKAYAPISYALSVWGVRTAKAIANAPDLASRVRRAGVKWMAPVAVQDVRHRSLIYAEAGNTETLRASWGRAMVDQADLVQLITWNDYSESTQLAPSRAHGWAFLDVNGYYVGEYKNWTPPTLTGDELVVTHRVQRFADHPTEQRLPMSWKLSGTGTRPRDTVEVLSILRAPAEVTLQIGARTVTYAAPAGISAHLEPLEAGEISAQAQRDGLVFAAAQSQYQLSDSLKNWDLQYYAVTSRGI